MRRSIAALLLALAVSPGWGQDAFRSDRPQGYAGEGHAENHEHYQGLTNRRGGSCCNGQDCRPTQARWNPTMQVWEAMVNGNWQSIADESVILDDAWLEQIGRPRWDNQAHVCASLAQGPGNKFVYCLILPESGN